MSLRSDGRGGLPALACWVAFSINWVRLLRASANSSLCRGVGQFSRGCFTSPALARDSLGVRLTVLRVSSPRGAFEPLCKGALAGARYRVYRAVLVEVSVKGRSWRAGS